MHSQEGITDPNSVFKMSSFIQLCLSLEWVSQSQHWSFHFYRVSLKIGLIFPLRNILNKCHNIYVWETLDVINHKSLNETPYLETPNINNNNAGSPLHGDVKSTFLF